jgi:3-phenylpropionate/trans-cinnamate dioxygenase ferredoxin reductase subunit
MSRKKVSVIVGSGLAGITAAETLRTQGFDGEIIVIGEDVADPYDRPPLSKGYLRGEQQFGEITLHPRSFYDENRIDLFPATKVEAVDVHGGKVHLSDGGRVSYDAALLATGASPRPLTVRGADLGGIHLLRGLQDADWLAADAKKASHVVVVGAGWIGTEVAASLRQLGKQVTIVAPESVPLERVLGGEIGSVFAQLHTDNGVDLKLGRGIAQFRGHRRVDLVILDDGTEIECDLVVVGIGVAPRDELAREAGIACDNGILVDQWLHSTGSNVYAAGDVANVAHPRYGRLRVEHWANAQNQGAAAARSMMGNQDRYDRIPYFFSDQYDLGMEYTGYSRPTDEVVVRGDLDSREFIAFWLDEGRVTAGMNVNVWDVTGEIEQLIVSGALVDPVALADQSLPLSNLVPAERVA